jgi:hypothetical protein
LEARAFDALDLVVFFVLLRRVCASDETATRDARANTIRKRSFLYSMTLDDFVNGNEMFTAQREIRTTIRCFRGQQTVTRRSG